MMRFLSRGMFAAGLVAATFLATTGVASAHLAEEASAAHVALEVVRWAAGVGFLVCLLLAAFWLRARWLEGRES